MREPTNKEISSYLEIPESMVVEAQNSVNQVQSLDEIVTMDDTFSLYELIPATIENIDDKIMLAESLKSLNKDEQKIIELRYFRDRTQSEIASIMNTNQTQISRQEQKILLKLRSNLKC